MNFDMNMLSSIMQMFGNKQSQTPQNQQNDKQVNSASQMDLTDFARQNNIGEQININSTSNEKKSQQGMFDSLSKSNQNSTSQQNPMFALLQMLQGSQQGNNADIMSLLPMLMSMTKPKAQSAECSKAPGSTDFPNSSQNVKKEKTQRFFQPIAFAGYNLMSKLCKLYLTSICHFDI